MPNADVPLLARSWLLDSAFPFWADAGFSSRVGGFYDKLAPNGDPVGGSNRIRVQTRQIYAFVQAGRIGWTGPWADRVARASRYIESQFKRPDGFYRSNADDADDAPLDLYDQAFVLLALAQIYGSTGARKCRDEAARLLGHLNQYCRSQGGGYVAEAADQHRSANPNMHLFEAFLAWTQVAGDERFAEAAKGQVALVSEHLFDEKTSTIGEVFDRAWQVQTAEVAGQRIVEPGHQFEWAFLLYWAESMLGVSTRNWANRLLSSGLRMTAPARPGISVFQVDPTNGHLIDGRARLWAQTERLRTLSLAVADAGYWSVQPVREFADSWAAVGAFLDVPISGLWHEWQDANGVFEPGDVPATSLYHLVSAFLSLPVAGADVGSFPY